ncbi:hypothetical protein [Actinomycetospora chiangmaiensis]|uniref:hypothetical protein n=1 Tax=Actinomycetospora chiangmaiensis TaxID=402650 RepID=UPI000362873D|nr:hypothetical protein [Actinomycetospora chiangmaiensis]
MAAHSAPSTRRQRRTTALTSIATALAVVGLMFLGSVLSSPSPGREPGSLGTTAGPVALVDAPAEPATPAPATPATTSTAPAVRKSEAPRTSARPTSRKPPTTTTAAD